MTDYYRKKPVVIKAFQFTEMAYTPEWFSSHIHSGTAFYQGGDEPYYTIQTLEGNMRANRNDWIIEGVKGEIYPCKPDIFAATYEAV